MICFTKYNTEIYPIKVSSFQDKTENDLNVRFDGRSAIPEK